MTDNENKQGADVDEKEVQERLEELERIVARLVRDRKRDDIQTKAAAGQLRKAKKAKTLEELTKILSEVAGNLEAAGSEGAAVE